jgi:hypothetical protein
VSLLSKLSLRSWALIIFAALFLFHSCVNESEPVVSCGGCADGVQGADSGVDALLPII